GGARAARARRATSRRVGHRCPIFSDIAARGPRGRTAGMLDGAPSVGASGPPWCNGSTPAFGAVRSGFESWGRSHLCATGAAGAPVPPGGEAPRRAALAVAATVDRVSLTPPAAVIVLAAGQGTRMRSATPKVLHRIGGRSLLGHVLATARGLSPARIAVVVRHERDQVAAHAQELDPAVLVADQDEVPGTGRAVECGLSVLDAAAQSEQAGAGSEAGGLTGVDGPVVILAGDVPLLDSGTLTALLEAHQSDGNAVTVLTTNLTDPSGYGRVVRGTDGQVAKIVEQKDATDTELALTEINSSVYVMDAAVLRGALSRLDRDNAQGEVYLTDVVALARADGGAVRALATDDPMLVEGVNDRVQLSALGVELNRRVVTAWMEAGVTVVDPATTWIDVDVQLEQDVTLLPGTQLQGGTRVATGAVVGPDSTLTDVVIGAGATVTRTHGSDSHIDDGATVGPFTYLRPGVHLGERGKLGAF